MEASVSNPPLTVSVYVCSEGHRTLSLGTVPASCKHLRTRSRGFCGLSVVPLSEAPADVQQRMLNPLKASKKASKK
jgi:hypothetical protein